MGSKAEIEPVVAMSGNNGNTSKKFDENFRKISEEKMKRLKEKFSSSEIYRIRYNISPQLKEFFKNNNIESKINNHSITNF